MEKPSHEIGETDENTKIPGNKKIRSAIELLLC